MTNLPNRETARQLAEILINNRVSACVNMLGPCQSIYHWQGKTQNVEEIPLLIKTTVARYAEVERLIRANHPYELPEIICVPVSAGLPAYLQWINDETQ